MPNLNRIACTRCQQSVFNCEIEGADGQLYRVPLVTRINQGQPADTGTPVPLDDPNIRMTSFTRANMLTPVPSIELCEKCLSEVMGWPLVSATEDPMYNDGMPELQKLIDAEYRDESRPMVERASVAATRPLHAIAVAWGDAAPGDLPLELQPVARETQLAAGGAVTLAELTDAELEAELARRREAESTGAVV